jgi:hypothetical protein
MSRLSYLEVPNAVIPAQADIQKHLIMLDSRLRGNKLKVTRDKNMQILTFYETIKG